MALSPTQGPSQGMHLFQGCCSKVLGRREKSIKIYMMFIVPQTSLEVVDREIFWGWPCPARANGKLPGNCGLEGGYFSGTLSSSSSTQSFDGYFISMDFRPSLILSAVSVFPPIFFILPQKHQDKIKQDLKNYNTHIKLVASFFCRVCLFFCTCCHLCYFDGLY